MSVRIFSDSTCDLSEELVRRYSVTIIPLCIVMGDKSYYDGEGVGQAEIFKWADENRTTPKTAAITTERIESAVNPVLEAGDDCILFTIASGMSSSFNLAQIYSEDNGNGHMFVIDSANLSTGIGHLVIKAAEMASKGMAASDIVEAIQGVVPRVRSSFVIDTLTYLSRGGRCSSVTALLAGTELLAVLVEPLVVYHHKGVRLLKVEILHDFLNHAFLRFLLHSPINYQLSIIRSAMPLCKQRIIN